MQLESVSIRNSSFTTTIEMRDIWTHTHTQIRATYHVLFPEIVHEEEVGGEWPLWRVRVFRLFRFLHLLAVLRIRLAPARDWIRVHLEEFRLDFVLGATHTHTHTHTHARMDMERRCQRSPFAHTILPRPRHGKSQRGLVAV